MEKQNTYTEARALFGARRAEITDAAFTGVEALSHARELTLADSRFSAPRPLAHISDAILRNIEIEKDAAAPLYGSKTVTIQGCEMDAPRGCEAAQEITVDASRIASDDFGADAARLNFTDTVLSGKRLLGHATDITAINAEITGDLALRYAHGGRVDFSTLAGEELLFGAKDMTISDTVLDGARMGWYSENLTLSHCMIIGERPFAYAKNLTLVDCALDESCVGAFERSEVEATIRGTVPSVCNPTHGSITADGFGEIIFDDTAVPGTDCRVITRQEI